MTYKNIIWKVIKPRHFVLLHHFAEANTESSKMSSGFKKDFWNFVSDEFTFYFFSFLGWRQQTHFLSTTLSCFINLAIQASNTGRGLSFSSFMQMSQPSELFFFFSSVFCFAYGNTNWVVFLSLIINPLHLMNVFTFQLQLIISMHSINAVLLLGETILNCLVSLVP